MTSRNSLPIWMTRLKMESSQADRACRRRKKRVKATARIDGRKAGRVGREERGCWKVGCLFDLRRCWWFEILELEG